ncbi:putative threonine efflux protein-like [Marinomonas sp. MED121]|uniref:LysE family translocator n=1 Tax=Marinomonas sp. MED121 TaxID=314277 RepID=UPI000069032A|nr:LysE family translocator [Marinomonas sp. MED121]EAQ66279.1 putative threonine efflux protein-like [Marinomonas sp. MED121]
MTLESGITFFIAIFIFGITPGPGIFAILAKSMTQGAKSCWWLSVGMSISDICYLIMACFGLASLAYAWEEVFLVIRVLGGAYLIYLGWKMWTSVPALAQELADPNLKVEKKTHLSSFVQGFMISASNPKVILFYIAFLPTFMDVTQLGAQDIAIASVLTFVALMLGLTMIALMAAQARKHLNSPKSLKIVNRTAGSIMASAGLYVGLRG